MIHADIAERLRAIRDGEEIERLATEIEQLRDEIERLQLDLFNESVEIERLRDEWSKAMDWGRGLQAEIERLRAVEARVRGDGANRYWEGRWRDEKAENERLRTFAHWVIKEGPFNGCNLDGGDVQDKAVELGILTETKYDPSIHGDSDSAEPGDQWFVFSEGMK